MLSDYNVVKLHVNNRNRKEFWNIISIWKLSNTFLNKDWVK